MQHKFFIGAWTQEETLKISQLFNSVIEQRINDYKKINYNKPEKIMSILC